MLTTNTPTHISIKSHFKPLRIPSQTISSVRENKHLDLGSKSSKHTTPSMLTATSPAGLVAVGSSLPAVIGRNQHPHRDKASRACRGARLIPSLGHSRIVFLTTVHTQIRPRSPRDHSQTLKISYGTKNLHQTTPNTSLNSY